MGLFGGYEERGKPDIPPEECPKAQHIYGDGNKKNEESPDFNTSEIVRKLKELLELKNALKLSKAVSILNCNKMDLRKLIESRDDFQLKREKMGDGWKEMNKITKITRSNGGISGENGEK